MRPQFFVPDLDPAKPRVALPLAEAHHLARVLRLPAGAEVVVFDGRGTAFNARVASTGRGTVMVTLGDAVAEPPGPAVSLTLVQSVLKGESMDAVVRDCTMVGVESVQPVLSDRTSVKASVLTKAVDRWRRIALASTKQCGRLRLPDIRRVMPFDGWVAGEGSAAAFVLVEPSLTAADTITLRDLAHRPSPSSATLVVGPEGGWTQEECNRALAAGCVPLSLGRLTLRAESVPLTAAAALLAIWET